MGQSQSKIEPKTVLTQSTQDRLIELQPPQEHKEFKDIVAESIDETITAVLSREVVDALYAHLQATYSISRDEVSNNLKEVAYTLEKIFGMSSKTIFRAIARNLYTKLTLPMPNNSDRSLPEYVEEAKANLREREGQP